MGRSLYSDYISSKNNEEAIASAQELAIPEFKPRLVRLGLEKAFDALEAGDRDAIMELIVDLCKSQVYTGEDIQEAVDGYAAQLEDLALDVPAAPRVLGGVLGMCVAAELMDLNAVKDRVEGVESAEPRRAFVASALHAVKEAKGSDQLRAAVKASGVDVLALFENDPEFEPHLPSAQKFAEEEGLLTALE